MFENSQHNKKVVIGSGIVAKAAIRRENGRIEFIVVFQESTRQEFYWIFSAKHQRAARRSWKYASHRARDCGMGDFKPYRDFHSFVEDYAKVNHAQVLTVRVQQKRRLSALLAKTAHESIHADWTPKIVSTEPRDYRKVNKRLDARIKGRSLDWSL